MGPKDNLGYVSNLLAPTKQKLPLCVKKSHLAVIFRYMLNKMNEQDKNESQHSEVCLQSCVGF